MTASEHPTDVDPATTDTGRTDAGRTGAHQTESDPTGPTQTGPDRGGSARVDSGRADNHTDSQQSRHLDDLGGQDRRDAVTSAESSRPHTSRADTSTADTSRADMDEREPLVPQQRAQDYLSRWDTLKGGFVDEPGQAVAAADQLVSELLGELQELFRSQRQNIERGLDADETSTEDLRMALRRYRSFFDRLLSV